MAKLRAGPWDYLIVDTPPAMMDRIEAAIRTADVVLIPVRASIFDVEAIAPVTEVCRDYGRFTHSCSATPTPNENCFQRRSTR